MSIRIRHAKEDDAQALSRVHLAGWRAAYSDVVPEDVLAGPALAGENLSQWQERLAAPAPGTFCHVAEDGACILGFALVGPARFPHEVPADVELLSFFLDPARIGQGIGALLLRHSLRHSALAGAASLSLWCAPENARARAFYARMGGLLVDGVTHRFRWLDRDWDDVAYRWLLRDA